MKVIILQVKLFLEERLENAGELEMIKHQSSCMKYDKFKNRKYISFEQKLHFEVQYQDVVGIFDLEDLDVTFEDYMPVLASFFNK